MKWGNPDQKFFLTKDWALTRLDHALFALIPYIFIILCGLICYVKPDGNRASKPRKERMELIQVLRSDPIKSLMIVYNAVQVILCVWMVYAAIHEALSSDYNLVCNAFNERTSNMAVVIWVFYLSKALDFFDTFFIVARGAWGQFTFLHCYHHVSIYLVYWLLVNTGYDGDLYLTVVLNGGVHAVMYSYYFMSIIGRPLKNKWIITVMQMTQFLLMNAQAAYLLVFGCPYPANLTKFYLGYIVSLFILFGNFFYKSFLTPKKPKSN
jgi:elongation of very long chain fatty acids protein 4